MKKEEYLYGDLVQEEEEIDKATKQRKKEYQTMRVPNSEVPSFLEKGWQLKKQFKTRAELRKKKDCGELLEDEIWLLFKDMGFTEMNKDRNFKIQAGPQTKQIDVFARDGNNIFIIECKCQSERTKRSLRKDMYEILSIKEEIKKSLWKHYKHKIRVSFLFITRNIIWNSTDEKIAKKYEKEGFFVWKEKSIEAYKNLVVQHRKDARFQMYSIIFSGKRIEEIEDIEVPAMRGGRGDKKYYLFLIHPEQLLQGVAYVHRREERDPEEVTKAYQRMLSSNRLKEIYEYIDKKGGFFPNNIIINFTNKPIFEPFGKKSEFGEISYGTLKFPPYYGSAWIIDGQHRLYGYSESKKRATETIPVVAFECLEVKDQANFFVDINKKQKSVSSSLLWDLYPDIYEGSKEEVHQKLRTISLIVKNLDLESDSIFYNRIKIPSILPKSKEITNLTITNICDAIKENRFINEGEGLLYEKDYDYTVNFATQVINAYFSAIEESFPKDWERGEKGLLRSNIGVRIFFIILRQLLKYLDYKGLGDLYKKKNLNDFKKETKKILNPVLTALKDMSADERDEIRKASNKGQVTENAQRLIWDLKERFDFGHELWRKGGWTPEIPPEEKDDKKIEGLVDNTECKLISYIIQELKKIHGKKWWKVGIPEGIKTYIEETIEKDISKTPYKRRDLKSASSERKLGFSSTSHLKEIIINGNNWSQFENTFAKDKENVSVAFKFFENIRNKYKHPERIKDLDEIEKALGYWNMKWIRRCIACDE